MRHKWYLHLQQPLPLPFIVQRLFLSLLFPYCNIVLDHERKQLVTHFALYCLHISTELPWDERGLISLLRFASFIPSHFVLSHSPLSSQLCAVDPLNNSPHSLPLVSAVSYQHESTKFSGSDRQTSVTAHTVMMCVCETSGVNAPERKKVMLCVVEWWNCTKTASPCCFLDGMRWCGGHFIHSNAMGGQ